MQQAITMLLYILVETEASAFNAAIIEYLFCIITQATYMFLLLPAIDLPDFCELLVVYKAMLLLPVSLHNG